MPKADSLIELKESNERLKLTLENLEMEATLGAVEEAKRITESLAYEFGDLIDPFEFLKDDPNFGSLRPLSPISLISDRRDGANFPIFRTETELATIRGQARLLEAVSSLAQCYFDNLCNYTIHTGFDYQVQPKDGAEESPAVPIAERIVQKFLEINDWIGDYERELHKRLHRDGEVFVWLQPSNRGSIRARIIEPEQVTEPHKTRELEEFVGTSFLPPQSWRFGVHTLIKDIESVFGYFVIWDEARRDWDYLKADQVEHWKVNVDRGIKRGVSDLYSTKGELERVAKFTRNVGEGAALQAAIAWIFESPPHVSQSGIQNMIKGQATEKFSKTHQTGRRTHYQREYPPGSVLHPSPGSQYKPGPAAGGREAGWEIVAGLLMRAVGNRACMPEFMISGDASNANYASTLAAESPFIKGRQHEQVWLTSKLKRLLWKVLKWHHGRGAFGNVTWGQIRAQVELEIETPEVASRNKIDEANVRQIQHVNGVLSRRTWATKAGLDYDAELSNQESEPAPAQGGASAGGAGGAGMFSGGFGNELESSPEEQLATGEFTDRNRRTWQRNLRAAKEILDAFQAGEHSERMALEFLMALGFDANRAQRLVDDVKEASNVAAETLADRLIDRVGVSTILEKVLDSAWESYP